MKWFVFNFLVVLLLQACTSNQPAEDKIDLQVSEAVDASEKALFDANFDYALQLVDRRKFEHLPGYQELHQIQLALQELRVIGFIKLISAEPTDYPARFQKLQSLATLVNPKTNRQTAGRFFLMFSDVHRAMGQVDSATYYEQAALDIFSKLDDKEELARLRASRLSRKHNQLLREGNSSAILDLIPHYKQEIDFSTSYSKYALAYNTRHLAQIYRRQTQEYETSLELFRKSLLLREEIGFRPFLPASYSSIGDVQLLKGNYLEAITAYESAQKLAEEIGFIRYQSYPLMKIGDCQVGLRDRVKAMEFYQEALTRAVQDNYDPVITQATVRIEELKSN